MSGAVQALIGSLKSAAAVTDPNWASVTLLLPGNGTNGAQNNTFLDASTNNFTITRNGNTTQGTFNPFTTTAPYSASVNGGSGYFDGTGDYLTVPDNAAFNFGNGDFTVEFWVYATTTGQSANSFLYSKPDGSGFSGVTIVQTSGAYTLRLFSSSTGVTWNLANNAVIGTMTQNTWHHVAITRSGTNMYAFMDGVLGSTTSVSTTSLLSTTGLLSIISNVGAANSFFSGYTSSLRVVKGTAVYTSAFTPPTAPLTAITNTSLLLNFTNAGIIDNAMLNDLETVGNAQISTAQSKFGGSSIAFDGAGDWLTAPNSVNYDLGSGDFTVELWVYFNSVGSLIYFVVEGSGINASPLATAGWALNYSTNNLQFNRYDGTTQTTYSFAWTPATGTWYHVAVSRSGTSLRAFVDGTQVGTTQTSSVTFNKINSTEPLTVGNGLSGGSPGTNYSLNGYIDDLRITKGVARYTANFTPPTAAFPLS